MPRGGPRPNSGRKKGSRNKRTIGIAERMFEVAGASTGSAAPQLTAKKLARDVLEDFMLRFTSMAERETDPIKFERYARFAVHCAQSLAPYQSPTLRAVMVAPQPERNDTTTITLKIFDHDCKIRGTPPYANASNRCNFIRELPAGDAVVPAINGSD
jgi:hypothetical protein